MNSSRAYKQNLSSNSLFHFVRKMDYLLDILSNGFQARFCQENIPFEKMPFAIPMKCFCDIPLGMIKFHVENYGSYGVGISKQYAKNQGITPIIYVHEDSNTLLNYSSGLIENWHQNKDYIMNSLIPYFKIYDGNFSLENGKSRYQRYYDEREWRYIPKDGECIYLKNIEKNKQPIKLQELNDKLGSKQYRLPISRVSAITYLIVKEESERQILIDAIRNKYSGQHSQDILISKIISAYRISRDF